MHEIFSFTQENSHLHNFLWSGNFIHNFSARKENEELLRTSPVEIVSIRIIKNAPGMKSNGFWIWAIYLATSETIFNNRFGGILFAL